MNSMLRLTAFALLLCSTASWAIAKDEPYLDATRKFRGDYGTGNKASMYQQHAQDYSRQLYYQVQVQPTAPKPALMEQATAVRKNMESSNKELESLKTATKADDEAQKLIASIQGHHAKVLKHCNRLDDCCKKDADAGMIGDCCADIDADMEAAKKDMDQLLKHLKIEALPVPKKAVEKDAPKK